MLKFLCNTRLHGNSLFTSFKKVLPMFDFTFLLKKGLYHIMVSFSKRFSLVGESWLIYQSVIVMGTSRSRLVLSGI